MYFKNIIAPNNIKYFLRKIYKNKRISHSLFFIGPTECGGLILAIAYAKMLLNKKKIISNSKIKKLQHPDLHFIFPISSNKEINHKNLSIDFLPQWIKFLNQYPYGNLFDWLEYIKIENKQAKIGVEEAKYIIKKLQIKSYEGGYKIIIMWMPERLHISASNKLLKILEEPPEKTVFLFIGEKEEDLLPTFKSRMQIIRIKPLSLDDIKNSLQKEYKISEKKALIISQRSKGKWGEALRLLRKTKENEFESIFIQWIRNIFIIKKKPKIFKDLIECSELINNWGRERQKNFLNYCLYIFRQALLTNYKIDLINFNPIYSTKFNWKIFSKYIKIKNIQKILNDISHANKDIEHNAYFKIVFLNLSINISKYLNE